jgi:hypothetical protein
VNAPTQFELHLLSTTVVVLALVYTLVKLAWNQPLKNGPGFFLGVEVPAGFYEVPGKTWLKGYHATLVALHLVLAVALAVIVAFKRWDLTPAWVGGSVLLYVPTMMGFAAWTRHKLGANPPVRPVALALESRRLSDYISWPLEILMCTVIALSWWLLFYPGTHFAWLSALQLTWTALGLLPVKIAMVRSSLPLPVEHTDEHYRLQDAERRNWIRVLSAFAWSIVVLLFGYALRHALSHTGTVPWLQWITVGVCWAFGGYAIILMFHGQRQLAIMGRDLRPAGSFATPFRRATWTGMSRSCLIWFAIWFGGILAMIMYSRFR